MLGAAKGDSNAQSNLALLYYKGKGVNQSDREAAKLFLKSARQGNKQALKNFEILCENSPWACKEY